MGATLQALQPQLTPTLTNAPSARVADSAPTPVPQSLPKPNETQQGWQKRALLPEGRSAALLGPRLLPRLPVLPPSSRR